MNKIIEAAKYYEGLKIKTLPTQEDKSPACSQSWKEDLDGGINYLYSNCYGIGVKCGTFNKNLECMDFDNHFGDAKKVISDFMQIEEVKEVFEGKNPLVEKTYSGGFHLIYRCNDLINGNMKLARRPKFDKELKKWMPDTIIETRGQDGYFVAAPSQNYKVIRGSFADIPALTKDEIKILHEAAKSFNTWIAEKYSKKFSNETDKKASEIYDNQIGSIDEAKQLLKNHGWTELQGNKWRRPGKTKGISATFGIVAPNVFYCFSTNGDAYPFTERNAHTPFSIKGLLEYNGDFKALSKDIYKENDHVVEHKKEPKKEEKPTPDKFKELLARIKVDTSKKIDKPPVILYIRDENGDVNRLFTLGNFSVIKGKQKSKKTFFNTMCVASLLSGNFANKFIKSKYLPKHEVVGFDTEQSEYDAYRMTKNVEKMANNQNLDYFSIFQLREFTPDQRIEIVEQFLDMFHQNICFLVIDGIADLSKSYNDEEEASKIGTLLLKWTKIYNIHISVIIHENKMNDFAMGWLGGILQKKAEKVITVEKDATNSKYSNVSNTDSRGSMDFEPFTFFINSDGMPELVGEYEKDLEEMPF
jgi:hypothetical protein